MYNELVKLNYSLYSAKSLFADPADPIMYYIISWNKALGLEDTPTIL